MLCCGESAAIHFLFLLHKKPRTIKHFTLPTGISRFWIRSGGPSKSAATAQREEVTPVSSMASPRKVQCHGALVSHVRGLWKRRVEGEQEANRVFMVLQKQEPKPHNARKEES